MSVKIGKTRTSQRRTPMNILLTWTCHLIGALALMAAGALLMRVRIYRRENQVLASERRRSELLIAKNRRRHEQRFETAAKELLRAQVAAERLAEDNGRLTTENAELHERLRQTPWIVNAWRSNTERGQA
jgi:hypothetical protein